MDTTEDTNRPVFYRVCDWEHVEEMLKVVMGRMPDIHHSSFDLACKACEDFFNLPEYFKDIPTARNVMKEMSNLHKKGKEFYDILDGLDPFTKSLLADEYALAAGSKAASGFLAELDSMSRLSLLGLVRLKKEVGIVKELAGKLKKGLAIEKMYPNRPRRGFIRTMATAYEKSTGRPAKEAFHCDNNRNEGKFTGEFFDLIWGCLVAAGARPHSQRALYDDIKKTLRKRPPQNKLWSATNQISKK